MVVARLNFHQGSTIGVGLIAGSAALGLVVSGWALAGLTGRIPIDVVDTIPFGNAS